MPGMFYIDKWYILLIFPCMLLSLLAQALVKSRFHKYSQIRNRRGYRGRDVAQMILRSYDILDVAIEPVQGQLTDHFSPKEKVLRLSEPVFAADSIAALGVAAHESGHAIQTEKHYLPNLIRQGIFPVARIGSSAGPWLAIIGLAMNAKTLFSVGILLYAAAVAFFIVTLPVEFDASRRAIHILDEQAILDPDELEGAKAVLKAAALTYVASAATALASLIRLLLLARERDEH